MPFPYQKDLAYSHTNKTTTKTTPEQDLTTQSWIAHSSTACRHSLPTRKPSLCHKRPHLYQEHALVPEGLAP